MPHWLFTTCVLLTQVLALFFSVYGVFGEAEGVAPCGYGWGFAVLGISLVYFMILDVVKVYCFRYWNFKLTAKLVPTKSRKEKLENRNIEKEYKKRIDQSWSKIHHTIQAHDVIAAFQGVAQEAELRNKASGAA